MSPPPSRCRLAIVATLTLISCARGADGERGDPSASAGDHLALDGDDQRAGDSGPGPDGGDPTPGDSLGVGDSAPGGDGVVGCTVADVLGLCLDLDLCAGHSFPGYCPGPVNIQCCLDDVVPCSVSGAPGICIDTSTCGDGWVSTPGYCPGPANVQCCTELGNACDPEAVPLPNEGGVEEDWDSNCPLGMVLVTDFCIDRYEAALVRLDEGGVVVGSWSPYFSPGNERLAAVSLRGAVPQGYISGEQAGAACAEAGKRLCSDGEWLRACQGASGYVYPYGEERLDGVCNDARAAHPVIEYFGTDEAWIWSELGHPRINQLPDSVHLSGQNTGCVSEAGALDMMGNLHEWTANPSGIFRGGFYVDTRINGEGCLYATTAHNVYHWDYSTGFRCCADP